MLQAPNQTKRTSHSGDRPPSPSPQRSASQATLNSSASAASSSSLQPSSALVKHPIPFQHPKWPHDVVDIQVGSQVYPHLFLGTVNAICSDPDEFKAVEFLKSKNITHILTVAGEIEDVPDIPKLEAALGRPIGWFHVQDASDVPGYLLIEHFQECCEFIEGALAPYYHALSDAAAAKQAQSDQIAAPKPHKASWFSQVGGAFQGVGDKIRKEFNSPSLPSSTSSSSNKLVRRGIERGMLNFGPEGLKSFTPTTIPPVRSPSPAPITSPTEERAPSPPPSPDADPDVPARDHEADFANRTNRVDEFYQHPYKIPDLADPLGTETGRNYPSVLIHCQMGISRSATIATAHLMRLAALFPSLLPLLPCPIPPRATFKQALAFLQSRRPVANPNVGFRKQLEAWEQMGSKEIKRGSRAWSECLVFTNIASGHVLVEARPPPQKLLYGEMR